MIDIIRTIFLFASVLFSFFVGCFVSFSVSIFLPKASRHLFYQTVASYWSKFLIFIIGINLRVEGIKNIPEKGPVLFVSNHQGAADIPIMLGVIPQKFRFIIKKELFDIPFFGWYLRKAEYIPVERGESRGAIGMFISAKKALKKGENILIFPEGTRSKDGNLQEFKRGSMLLAVKGGIPVVPIAISGSYDIMLPGKFVVKKVNVTVKIGKLIILSDSETSNEIIFSAVKNLFDEIKNNG